MQFNHDEICWKITNEEECHFGFQYKNGLNILPDDFNDNLNDSCCPGGFYFTTSKYLYKFLHYGVNLRRIYLPILDEKFKIVADSHGDKFRTNMIIFGEKYSLSDPKIYDIIGLDSEHFHNKYFILEWLTLACKNGYVEVVKFLFKKEYYISHMMDLMVEWATEFGQMEIIRFAIKHGANVRTNHKPLILACQKGHLDAVVLFLEYGADPNASNYTALGWACQNGHLDIVKHLIVNGANYRPEINDPVSWAVRGEHLLIIKYLLDIGADLYAAEGSALRWAVIIGNIEIVKYLINFFIRTKNDISYFAKVILLQAVVLNNFDIIEYVTSKKINHPDDYNAAFILATTNENISIISYLHNNLQLDLVTYEDALRLAHNLNQPQTVKYLENLIKINNLNNMVSGMKIKN